MYCPNCLSENHWLSDCDELTKLPAEQFNLCIETEKQTRSLSQKTSSACEEEAHEDSRKPSATSNKSDFTLVGKARTSTKLKELTAFLSVTQGQSLPVEATLSASLKVHKRRISGPCLPSFSPSRSLITSTSIWHNKHLANGSLKLRRRPSLQSSQVNHRRRERLAPKRQLNEKIVLVASKVVPKLLLWFARDIFVPTVITRRSRRREKTGELDVSHWPTYHKHQPRNHLLSQKSQSSNDQRHRSLLLLFASLVALMSLAQSVCIVSK